MKHHVGQGGFVAFIFAVVFACLFIVTVAALVEERSTDKLRLTVHRDDLLASVQGIQGACRCLVEAVPLGGEEDEAEYWLLHFHKGERKG